MLIALFSILISSVALMGVAVGLILQAQQLRAGRIQASAASQVQLMKFALDNPAAALELMGNDDPEAFAQEVILNWHINHLLMSYNNKTLSEAHLRRLVRSLFAAENSRNWWTIAGASYNDDATSRREKRFFAIVDAEFQQAGKMPASAEAGYALPDEKADFPPRQLWQMPDLICVHLKWP
jgi:Family of unknown function (DUF6082)